MSHTIEAHLSFRLYFQDEVILRPYGSILINSNEVPRVDDEVYFHPPGGRCKVLSVQRHYERHTHLDDILSAPLVSLSHIEIVLESLDAP